MIGPVTSATVERSNSSLRFVKSCFRSTMIEHRLNALSLLFIQMDVALDYDAIIDDYAKRNKWRMTFINPLQWIYLRLVLESCPWDALPLLNFFYYKSSLNLCSKPTFLVANDQSSRNACSKYPSETNWIWQFFRETILLPLLGGCAPAAIASAPASIIKFKRPECARLHLRELQSRRSMRPKLPRNVRRRFAVLMGAIVLILPLYTVTVSLGPLYHKILRPPLIEVNVLHTKKPWEITESTKSFLLKSVVLTSSLFVFYFQQIVN